MLNKSFLFLVIFITKTVFCASYNNSSNVSTAKLVLSDEQTLLEELQELQTKVATLESKIEQIQTQQDENDNHDVTTPAPFEPSPNYHFPKHCQEVQSRGHNTSDIYFIQPKFAPEPFPVFCDMKTKGWAYILSRFDGSQEFYFDWNSYKEGFGNLNGEFWLGLDHIHHLTGFEHNELLVELEDWDQEEAFARYKYFSVGGENEGYALKILGGYSGGAGDSLEDSAGMKFTTKDNDQDVWNEKNCAVYSEAAWWYRDCKGCQLTGKYVKGGTSNAPYTSLCWKSFKGDSYSLKSARMMVRPLTTEENY